MDKIPKKFILFLSILFLTLLITFLFSFKYVEKYSKLNIYQSFKNLDLKTHQNKKISSLNLKGTSVFLFFGFTNCPEVCPTTLSILQNLINQENRNNKPIKIIFVTLDPNRDDVDTLNDYLSSFDKFVIGITGNIRELTKLAKYWNVYWEKIPYDQNDYNINHTATVFMINENGDFSGTIAWGENENSQRLKIRSLIGKIN